MIQNFKKICETMKARNETGDIERTLANLKRSGDQARIAILNEVFGEPQVEPQVKEKKK